jgi:alkyl hydroperoxide reductase subunit AhpF
MALINDSDREKIRERISGELQKTVHLKLFSEPGMGLYVPGRRTCATCSDTEELMKEVAELSELIELEIVNVREKPEEATAWGVALTPTIAVYTEDDSGVRILGLPSGFEFLSFLETLISAGSANGFGLQAETLTKLGALESDVEIKVFATPT